MAMTNELRQPVTRNLLPDMGDKYAYKPGTNCCFNEGILSRLLQWRWCETDIICNKLNVEFVGN
jgi:hypothetical protein